MIDFATLNAAVQASSDALRNDECTVEPLFRLNKAAPQIIGGYHGNVFLVRVPTLEEGETEGLELSQEELDWDAGWKGKVLVSGDQQQVLTTILSTPAPEDAVPPVNLSQPPGLFAAAALNFTSGGYGAIVPGIFFTDLPNVRATYGSSQVSTIELWFRWNGDATDPVGTTRNIGLSLRQADPNNAIEIIWEVEPSNIGVKVQRRVGGVVTAETPAQSNIPAIFPGGKWQKLRVDLVGSTLTVRVNDSNPFAWQGTLSGDALSILGPPGLISTNGWYDFAFWAPPPPAPTATVLKVDVTPQANRPAVMLRATPYPIGGGPAYEDDYGKFVTYERIVAAATKDRLTFQTVAGANSLGLKMKPEPGDLINGGNRAGTRLTGIDVARRKCLIAYQGDRTRDTLGLLFPSAGMPTDIPHSNAGGYTGGVWGIAWQYHQAGNSGGSPPIELAFRQHPVTGIYWIWLRLRPQFYDAQGQYYTLNWQPDGTMSFGTNGVFWAEELQLDHNYTFMADVRHSAVGAGESEATRLGKRGKVTFAVDGVTKVSGLEIKTLDDDFNFVDSTLYQNRSINKSRHLLCFDWLHEHIPGPPISGTPAVPTNPLWQYYTAPA